MKKLFYLILACATLQTLQAEVVNGFSTIGAENPMKKKSRIQASEQRIDEEIGNPVNLKNFTEFAQKTQTYLDTLQHQKDDNLNEDTLKIAVKAVSDLMRATKKLPQVDQPQAEELITPLKQELKEFHLGRLQTLLTDAQS